MQPKQASHHVMSNLKQNYSSTFQDHIISRTFKEQMIFQNKLWHCQQRSILFKYVETAQVTCHYWQREMQLPYGAWALCKMSMACCYTIIISFWMQEFLFRPCRGVSSLSTL